MVRKLTLVTCIGSIGVLVYHQAQHGHLGGQVGQGHYGGEGLLMVRMVWVVTFVVKVRKLLIS